MRSLSKFRGLLSCIVGAFVACSTAEIIPGSGAEALDHLFDSSATVIRGEVKQVLREGQHQGTWHGIATILTTFVATVSVDETYKGRLLAETQIRYDRPADRLCATSRCPELTIGEFDYFFLPDSKSTHVFGDDLYSHKARASRLRATTRAAGIVGLIDDFVAGLQDPDESVQVTQIELIGRSEHREDAEHLNKLLATGDDLVRGSVYYAQLRLHDYSSLGQMQIFLEGNFSNPSLQKLRFLCLSEINALKDPATLRSLEKLASSKRADVREPAFHALRNIASSDTVPLFVKGLDDDVPLVRYDAVLALATIEKNWELAPSVDTFAKNESSYISAWKTWWQVDGRQKYRKSTNSPP